MGTHDHAITFAQRARALATASGDLVLHALANLYLGVAYQFQGDYHRAIDCFKETVASLDGERGHQRFGQFFLPAVVARAWLAVCHAELGMFAEGRAFGEEGLRLAEAVAHPGSLVFASWGAGLSSLRQGALPRAIPLLERAVGICQDADLPATLPWMAPALGAAYTLGGRLADAVALLTQVLDQMTAMGIVVTQALCRLFLAEAHLRSGRLQEAHTLADHTLWLARAHQERGHQAYALHFLGEIAAHHDRPRVQQATTDYHQALSLADELGMRPLQAHCHHGLGRLYCQIGRREPARAELSTAIELYGAMGMSFWLPEAEAALAQVA